MKISFMKPFCLIAFALSSFLPVQAQDGWNMDLVGRGMYDGRMLLREFAANGDYLYLASQLYHPERDIFTVVDITNPLRPIRLASLYEEGYIGGFFLQDSLLFMTTNGPVIVYDVQNASSPIELGRFDNILGWGSIKEFNGLLVSTHGLSLRFLDVTDIENPQIIGTIDLGYEPFDFELYENHVLISNYARIPNLQRYLEIYDISDLQHPELISTTDFDPGLPSLGIEVAGDYAYLFYGLDGIQIFDISDPASPESVATRLTDFTFIDLEQKDEYLYAAPLQMDSLIVLDNSDRVCPVIWTMEKCSRPLNLLFEGDQLHVSTAGGAISYFNVVDPGFPLALGTYVPGAYGRCLAVSGGYAYVGDTDGFKTLDISDPSYPVAINEYYHYNACQNFVSTNDEFLFFHQDRDIIISSLDQPQDPTRLATFHIEAGADDVYISDDYIYIPYFWRYYDISNNGFIIADISDPENPVELGSYVYYRPYFDYYSLVTLDSYVYTAEEYDSIGVYDASDPTQPQLINRIGTFPGVFYIDRKDNTLYAISWQNNRFYSLDLTNPANPVLSDSIIIINPRRFSIDGNFAYVADSIGVEAIDISDPLSLELVARFPIFPENPVGSTSDIQAVNQLIYVSTFLDGLFILDHYTTDIIRETGKSPSEFVLGQNYPDPFNASTTIQYNLPQNSSVTLEIFDILGRRIELLFSGYQTTGTHSIVWNADGESSGVYFYRIETGDYLETKKMILLK